MHNYDTPHLAPLFKGLVGIFQVAQLGARVVGDGHVGSV